MHWDIIAHEDSKISKTFEGWQNPLHIFVAALLCYIIAWKLFHP